MSPFSELKPLVVQLPPRAQEDTRPVGDELGPGEARTAIREHTCNRSRAGGAEPRLAASRGAVLSATA